MTAGALEPSRELTPVNVGGFGALAEGAWMGPAQASDVVEAARIHAPSRRVLRPREWLRPPRLRGLFHRELSVAEASVLLMGAFLVSALLGSVRQVLFNAHFGSGADASAYYAAARLPDTLFSLIAGGALSSAMIPVLVATRRNAGREAEARLAGLVLSALVAALGVFVVAAELFAAPFVSVVLAPGFDRPTTTLTVALTRLMLLQPLILAAGSVATAMLNSRSRFALTAASLATHNVGVILGIVATDLHPAFGVWGPAAGVVVGAIVQLLILLPGLSSGGVRARPAWAPGDAGLRDVVRLLGPNGAAVGVGYAGFIVDTAFASEASQSAALPAVQNAWMLVGLAIALLGQAVGQSIFPRLAALAEDREWQRLRQSFTRALLAVLALSLPALAGLLVLGRPVIRAIFEHGAFGADAGSLTYRVVAVYALALPACVASELIVRGLIALRDTRTPLVTNSLQVGTRVALLAATITTIGVVAIPLAFAATATAEALLLAAVFWRKLARRAALDEIRGSPAAA